MPARVVVRYGEPAMVMPAAYDLHGAELTRSEIEAVAQHLGWRCAQVHAFADAAELIAHAASLPATSEGFVVRFADGRRIKVKGAGGGGVVRQPPRNEAAGNVSETP